MKRPKVWRQLAMCSLLLFLCTGCWDAAEIDDLAIVTAAGWDIQGSNVVTSVQVARPSELGSTSGGGSGGSTGTSQTFVLEQGVGVDPVSALEEARRKLSRRMILSHREVLVLGEDFARQQGVSTLLDEVVRDPQSRLRTDVLVAYHTNAEDILKLPYALNRMPARAIRGMEQTGTMPRVDAREFIADLTDDRDPYAVGIEPVETLSENEPQTFRLDHVAVFRRDKLVGWLENRQVEGLLWIEGEMRNLSTTVSVPGRGYVGLKLDTERSTVTPVLQRGRPEIRITVQATDDIIENGTSLDFNQQQAVEQVRAAAEQQIESDIKRTLDVLQHQYHADICGFGQKLYEHYPRLYQTQLKPNWDQVYENLPVDVQVNLQVRRSGLTVQSLK
ncbi:Ger(x)C family spore germination protein [Alicyclobacillus cycloheptanicus]|uniref:Spore germination protein KC n=1 Tax=Alicyclobacillus cycloheptanicus TaxID=1457 RepID=A0ABT9XJD6_9BACL|nr:Ger(x)C family spore germination protein [Alicyclobacillus cycloheptanicus]MDQ0190235.1 spore germination protein KC [Alicyclobacillus cycloheptanicus]